MNPAQEIIDTLSRYDRIKSRVNTSLNSYPNEKRTARGVKSFLAIFISANTIAGVLSTVPNLPPFISNLIFAIISISLPFFTIDCILRLWSCTHSPTFMGRI